MSTTIRPELSEKNKYWIERHRYYELKHFCLQYPIWKKARATIDGFAKRPFAAAVFETNEVSSPTERCVMSREYYGDRMELLERVAKETDESLANYILKGVTEGLSYEILKARLDVPCCKATYYDLYRRFFWLLSRARG